MVKKELTVADFVQAVFPVQCKGRDADNREVLEEAVSVKVEVYKSPDSNLISTQVKCPYISGAHGEKCAAAGNGTCAYAIELGRKQ